MKMTICVTVEGRYGTYKACKVLPEYQRECFEPLNTSDDSFLAAITGDVVASSMDEVRVIKTRENTAKELAKELVPMLVNAMKSKDTKNGYARGLKGK